MGKGRSKKQPQVFEPQPADDEDDEEIPEDEAFNSDDERKYGCFFEKNEQPDSSEGEDAGSGLDKDDFEEDVEESSEESEGSGSDEEGSGSEEGGDGGQYMLDLLDKLEKKEPEGKHHSKPLSSATATHTKESEFSASVVPKASLTLDSLMKGLEDTQGFGVVQRQLKKVAQGAPTAAPLARVVSERAKRKVHYVDQAKDVSQWLAAVQENRQAETLDFRPKERMELTKDLMVEKFVPTTDFEKQIHQALMQAGQQDEEAILKAEQEALDDLGANEITLEEYKKRCGQLAKMRALMFYQERKNHQIKKIKSKTYRRIRKRQRERAKQVDLEARTQDDTDLVRELEEKEEMERMKERMTLAHKNTSKWARRVLKRGKNVDLDTRRALSAQLKRGADLLHRMKSTRAGANEGDGDSDEDLAEAARKVLAETEEDANKSEEPEGLLKLAFMQKGIERQRQQAREEARELLRELEERDGESVDAGSSASEDEDEKNSSRPKVASKEEMKRVSGKDELVASQLMFGNSVKIAVSGDIQIDMGNETRTSELGNNQVIGSGGAVSVHNSTLTVPTEQESTKDSPSEIEKTAKSRHTQKASTPKAGADESNPWLPAQEQKPEKKPKKASLAAMVNVERAIDLLEPVSGDKSKSTEPDPSNESTADKKIMSLTQQELVQRAFATISEKEVDEEFAKEKQAVEGDEDPTTKERNKKPKGNVGVDGWGSWTGKGAPPAKPPRKLPKRLQAPEKTLQKRKRADEKKQHVIISEKRLKKLADNYMVAEVPFPFTCREEYERAMAGGVGKEWNVTNSFKDLTRPEIMTRAGKVIQPISIKVKQKRPAAKF